MAVKRNPNAPYWQYMDSKERELIEGVLRATEGNVTRAASALGIDRSHLTTRIRRIGIDRKKFMPSKVTS